MKEKGKDRKNRGAEKPVSLWGASFREVVDALLETNPRPKGKEDVKEEETKEIEDAQD